MPMRGNMQMDPDCFFTGARDRPAMKKEGTTAAPYGPIWMPQDCTPEQKLPVTWEEQTQAAVDCYNAGATLLHIHVRDPKTGHVSKNFNEYADQVGRLRKACPR